MNNTVVKTIASAVGISAVGVVLAHTSKRQQDAEPEMPRLKIIQINLPADTTLKLQRRTKKDLTVEQILSNNF
jgi:hypothetical protein